MIPGPCVICGGTNYELSCGGPTICPKCDCGNFDAATVMKQAKVIAELREQLVSARRALTEMVEAFEPFTSKPMGAPNSDARIQQQLQIAAHRNAKAALSDEGGK